MNKEAILEGNIAVYNEAYECKTDGDLYTKLNEIVAKSANENGKQYVLKFTKSLIDKYNIVQEDTKTKKSQLVRKHIKVAIANMLNKLYIEYVRQQKSCATLGVDCEERNFTFDYDIQVIVDGNNIIKEIVVVLNKVKSSSKVDLSFKKAIKIFKSQIEEILNTEETTVSSVTERKNRNESLPKKKKSFSSQEDLNTKKSEETVKENLDVASGENINLENSSTVEKLAELIENLSDTNAKYLKAQESFLRVESEKKALETQLKEIEKKYEELENTSKLTSEKHIQELEKLKQEYETKIVELNNNYENLQAQHITLQETSQELENKLSATEDEIRKVKKSNNTSEKKIAELNSLLDKKGNLLTNALQEVETFKARKKEFDNKIQDLGVRITHLETIVKEKEEEIITLKKNLESLHGIQEKYDKLLEEHNIIQRNLEEIQSTNTENAESVNADEYLELLQEKDNNIRGLKLQLHELKLQLDEATASMALVAEPVVANESDKFLALQLEKATVEGQRKNLQDTVADYEEKNKNYTKEISEMKKKISELEVKNNALISELNYYRSSVESGGSNVETQNELLAIETLNADSEQEDLKKQIEQKTAQITSLEEHLQTEKDNVEKVKKEIEEVRTELLAEKKKYKELEETNAGLITQIASNTPEGTSSELQAKLEETEKQLQEVSAKCETLEASFHEKNSEVTDLRSTITSLEKSVEENKRVIQTKSERIDELNKEHAEKCDEFEKQIDELQQNNAKLERTLKEKDLDHAKQILKFENSNSLAKALGALKEQNSALLETNNEQAKTIAALQEKIAGSHFSKYSRKPITYEATTEITKDQVNLALSEHNTNNIQTGEFEIIEEEDIKLQTSKKIRGEDTKRLSNIPAEEWPKIVVDDTDKNGDDSNNTVEDVGASQKIYQAEMGDESNPEVPVNIIQPKLKKKTEQKGHDTKTYFPIENFNIPFNVESNEKTEALKTTGAPETAGDSGAVVDKDFFNEMQEKYSAEFNDEGTSVYDVLDQQQKDADAALDYFDNKSADGEDDSSDVSDEYDFEDSDESADTEDSQESAVVENASGFFPNDVFEGSETKERGGKISQILLRAEAQMNSSNLNNESSDTELGVESTSPTITTGDIGNNNEEQLSDDDFTIDLPEDVLKSRDLADEGTVVNFVPPKVGEMLEPNTLNDLGQEDKNESIVEAHETSNDEKETNKEAAVTGEESLLEKFGKGFRNLIMGKVEENNIESNEKINESILSGEVISKLLQFSDEAELIYGPFKRCGKVKYGGEGLYFCIELLPECSACYPNINGVNVEFEAGVKYGVKVPKWTTQHKDKSKNEWSIKSGLLSMNSFVNQAKINDSRIAKVYGGSSIVFSHNITTFKEFDKSRYINKIIKNAKDGKIKDTDVFVVMEHCDGENLSEYIGDPEENSYEVDKKILFKVTKNLLDLLKLLHSQDILHRDVNPNNILIQKDGSIKLIDFSSDLQAEVNRKEGIFSGSPQNISDEALRMDKDRFHDYEGAGFIFYELLTGGKYSEVNNMCYYFSKIDKDIKEQLSRSLGVKSFQDLAYIFGVSEVELLRHIKNFDHYNDDPKKYFGDYINAIDTLAETKKEYLDYVKDDDSAEAELNSELARLLQHKKTLLSKKDVNYTKRDKILNEIQSSIDIVESYLNFRQSDDEEFKNEFYEDIDNWKHNATRLIEAVLTFLQLKDTTEMSEDKTVIEKQLFAIIKRQFWKNKIALNEKYENDKHIVNYKLFLQEYFLHGDYNDDSVNSLIEKIIDINREFVIDSKQMNKTT